MEKVQKEGRMKRKNIKIKNLYKAKAIFRCRTTNKKICW